MVNQTNSLDLVIGKFNMAISAFESRLNRQDLLSKSGYLKKNFVEVVVSFSLIVFN